MPKGEQGEVLTPGTNVWKSILDLTDSKFFLVVRFPVTVRSTMRLITSPWLTESYRETFAWRAPKTPPSSVRSVLHCTLSATFPGRPGVLRDWDKFPSETQCGSTTRSGRTKGGGVLARPRCRRSWIVFP